jgi:SAM-dependent methyltransferase
MNTADSSAVVAGDLGDVEVQNFDAATYKAAQKQSWSKTAEGWTEGVGRAMMRLSAPLIEFCEVRTGERVLDLATGGGSAAFAAARAGAREVIASDLARGFEQVVKEKAIELGLNDIVRFAEADMEALQFADNEFDRITCQLGIMFPPDREKALREIFRILKPGGVFAAATLASAEENQEFAPVIEVPRRMLGANPNSPHPLNCGDRVKIQQEFREAGFVDVDQKDFDFQFEHRNLEDAERDWCNTGPFEVALNKVNEADRTKLLAFLREWLTTHQLPNGTIQLANRALLFRGRKPK